jgi:ribosomal protein S4E
MIMKTKSSAIVRGGDHCNVVGGTHAGISDTVRDVHTSKIDHIMITVEQTSGVRFKTLAKNVVIQTRNKA